MIPPHFYIHTFPGSLCPPLYQIRQSCRHQRCSPTVPHCGFNFSHKWPTLAFTGEIGYTLVFRRKMAHSGSHAEIGGVLGGGAIITLDTSCTFTNIPGPGVRAANFAAFGSWSGGALEERREPAEQRCAYARRCSKASRPRWAALPRLQFGGATVLSLCARYFLHVRGKGGITTLGVLYMSSKCPMPACQSG